VPCREHVDVSVESRYQHLGDPAAEYFAGAAIRRRPPKANATCYGVLDSEHDSVERLAQGDL
jgi:hypothetical protein